MWALPVDYGNGVVSGFINQLCGVVNGQAARIRELERETERLRQELAMARGARVG
jgi:hypothetical protein